MQEERTQSSWTEERLQSLSDFTAAIRVFEIGDHGFDQRIGMRIGIGLDESRRSLLYQALQLPMCFLESILRPLFLRNVRQVYNRAANMGFVVRERNCKKDVQLLSM